MPKTPETVRAVTAEMRDFAKPRRVGGDLCSNVALPATISIWADRIEAALAQERCARATLARIHEHLHRDDYTGELYFNTFDYDPIEEVEAALEEPPRNCDLYEDGPEALFAYKETLRDGEEVRVPWLLDWLFARTERKVADHA
jgi:hypothetical protein